jgi:hypothetical protein
MALSLVCLSATQLCVIVVCAAIATIQWLLTKEPTKRASRRYSAITLAHTSWVVLVVTLVAVKLFTVPLLVWTPAQQNKHSGLHFEDSNGQ